jgi:hypothetical protein
MKQARLMCLYRFCCSCMYNVLTKPNKFKEYAEYLTKNLVRNGVDI